MSFGHVDAVMYHALARGTDLVILMGIASHDGDGGAWPSIARLARYARADERTVRRSLARLVDAGELAIEYQAGGTSETRHDRRPNRYRVLVACPPGCSGAPHHLDRGDAHVLPSRGGAHARSSTSRGDAHVRHGGTPTSPEPIHEPTPPQPPAQRGERTSCTRHSRPRRGCAACAAPPAPPPPPWCGSCDPTTRLFTTDPDRPGEQARTARCRRCHPSARVTT